MRALAVFFLFLAAWTADARAPLPKLSRTVISGSDYFRVEDWADNDGFNMRWEKNAGVISLTGSAGRLVFMVDSRRAEICGVNVWLSLPVVNRGGVAMVSAVDASTTLEPILFPKKSETHLQTICLDPGHGGKDTGKIEGRNYEKNYTLLLARDVAEILKREGLKVLFTRDTDEFIELPNRPLTAKRRGADLFVSMHYNAGERPIRGLEVYCMSPAGVNSSNEGGGKAPYLREPGNIHDEQNALLAYEVQKKIPAGTTLQDRGMRRARFVVLREATVPAILIEGGYMSNPSDAKNIYDSAYRKRMAECIVAGIMAYKKTVERS